MLQKYKYIFGIVYNIFSDSLSKQDGRKKGEENVRSILSLTTEAMGVCPSADGGRIRCRETTR
jgi:hypothetical protein